MPATIDVVIPAYNRFELTASCLTHLRAQTVPHRVIVVDDGSTDDTRARLREEWPEVTIVELDENRPFTVAVNLGVRAGEGDYVVLLNNDVDLLPACLERLVEPLDADPSVGSVASVMLRPGGEQIDSVGVAADATLAGFARLQGLPTERAGDRQPLLCGAEGTAGAYRRSAWEQVGGLDERIEAYMEILDVALKLHAAGWGVASATGAVGVHLGSSTYGRRSARQRRMSGFSRAYLLRRWGVMRGRHGPRALVTEVIVIVGDALICRDAAALAGRVAGWRAARGLPRHRFPDSDAFDPEITLRRSLQLRRGVYRLPAES